jgi:Lar family restriction alleviation protein
MSELKPCPFCQSKDVLGKYAVDEVNQLGTAYIVCMDCRARGPYEYGEQQARDAWNLRITDEEVNR